MGIRLRHKQPKAFDRLAFLPTQGWDRLHEQAFRCLAGCPRYVTPDKRKKGVLKGGVLKPELYAVRARAQPGAVLSPQGLRSVCDDRCVRADHSSYAPTLHPLARWC